MVEIVPASLRSYLYPIILILIYYASSFASGCFLLTNSSHIPSLMMYRSGVCKSLRQVTIVPATTAIWYFWVMFSGQQWALMMSAVFDVFVSYSSALHIPLARAQGLSLMVTTDNSTALKVNSITEDILICSSFRSKRFCIWSTDTKRKILSSSH